MLTIMDDDLLNIAFCQVTPSTTNSFLICMILAVGVRELVPSVSWPIAGALPMA
jgi:hypothetical protein